MGTTKRVKSDFSMIVSPGGVKLKRQAIRSDQDGAQVVKASVVGGGGDKPRAAKRGRITEFTAKSRQEMRWTFNALPWETVPGRLAMVTLTYPVEFPRSGETIKSHFAAFQNRWRRRYGRGPVGAWALEFQERGAPHFHFYVGLPDESEVVWDPVVGQWVWEWALEAWFEIVGSGESDHRAWGVNVQLSASEEKRVNGLRVGEYFWRESGKWIQKQVPEGFEDVGAFWRYSGMKKVEYATSIRRDEYVRIRRPLLRLRAQRSGGKIRRPRGLDGTSVVGVDGFGTGVRLRKWAAAEIGF
jgi:hypothetical protein